MNIADSHQQSAAGICESRDQCFRSLITEHSTNRLVSNHVGLNRANQNTINKCATAVNVYARCDFASARMRTQFPAFIIMPLTSIIRLK